MRLKPVGQGQARDMASSVLMLGEESASAGLSDWVNGGGRQTWGRRLWQTAAMRRRQVSQNGRWMVPPVWHRDPCALCFT